jgi:hypothetical protein
MWKAKALNKRRMASRAKEIVLCPLVHTKKCASLVFPSHAIILSIFIQSTATRINMQPNQINLHISWEFGPVNQDWL